MDLDDVLNEYVSAFPEYPPTHPQMMEWIRQYPQYKQDIVEFTLAWYEMESAPKMPPLDPAFEEKLIESGMEVVRRILAEKKAGLK